MIYADRGIFQGQEGSGERGGGQFILEIKIFACELENFIIKLYIDLETLHTLGGVITMVP